MWSARTPESRTVTPRASSRLIVSARTEAPVASSDATRDMPQDDDADVADLRDLEQEGVGGTEEQRPVQAVGDDVLVDERLLLVGVVAVVERDLVEPRRARHLLQREAPATMNPRMTAVTRSRAMVAAAVMTRTAASPRVERSSALRLETSTIWMAVASRTPASAASGIQATHCDATRTTSSSASGLGDGREPGRAPERTLTAVRAIAAVAGMPPNSGTREVGDALPEQLAVGVVPFADGHPVGDGRRQEALERGERRDGDGRQQQLAQLAGLDRRQRGRGESDRDRADRRDREMGGRHGQGHGDDRDQRHGQAGSEPGGQEHRTGHQAGDHGWRPTRATQPRRPATSTAVARTFSPATTGTPSAAGSCCRAMITAIPTVNPSTTGSGT